MVVPVDISNKVGKSEITLDSFDVDHIKSWICKKMLMNEQDYKMIFHLVPSFKIELVYEPTAKKTAQKEVENPTEKEQPKPKVKKKSVLERRNRLKNKRSSAKALVERKAIEVIEREKQRKLDQAKRAKEAEETKKKYQQKPKEKNEPSMLELVTAKVEGVGKKERLNPNPKLGFTLNDKLTQKIKTLHELLLQANLVSANDSKKIYKLQATAEECINYIKELGED